MFGPLPHITCIMQKFKLLDNIWKILLTDISNGIPCIFFFELTMVLILREVINPFTDPPQKSFGSEYVILIFSRLPNFNDMSKVIYF